MSTPVNSFSAARPARVQLCSAPLSPADQELVDDAWAWSTWTQEQKAHRPKAAQKDEMVCIKCDGPLTWDGYRRAYSCDSCGWSEPSPKMVS
jgi:hypothetical protein